MGFRDNRGMGEIAQHLENLERRLLDPGVRSLREEIGRLLSDDFVEIGSSGRTYDKTEILDQMVGQTPAPVIMRDFVARRIAPGVFVCTYRSVGMGGNEALRSSTWVAIDDEWRMVFHQGTRVTSPDLLGQT